MIQIPNRLGRLSFMAGYLLLMLGVFSLFSTILMFSPSVQNFSTDAYNDLRYGIPPLLYIIGGTILQTRRLHDFNHSGWWAVGLNLVFVISFKAVGYKIHGALPVYTALSWIYLISFCALCLIPGTTAPNRFGAMRPATARERVCGWIAVLPLALISLLILKAELSNDSRKITQSVINKYHTQYPFTPDLLWNNILKITALPDGKFTKTQVEQALGVTLHPVESNVLSSDSYEAKEHSDWYFDIHVNTLILGHSLHFQLGWMGLDTKAGNSFCMNVDSIKPSLIAQGWILSESQSNTQIIPIDVYHKSADGTLLQMNYALQTRCIKRLDLYAPL